MSTLPSRAGSIIIDAVAAATLMGATVIVLAGMASYARQGEQAASDRDRALCHCENVLELVRHGPDEDQKPIPIARLPNSTVEIVTRLLPMPDRSMPDQPMREITVSVQWGDPLSRQKVQLVGWRPGKVEREEP
jgi:hypothetical protein